MNDMLSARSSTFRSFKPQAECFSDFEDLTQSVQQADTARLPVHRPLKHEMAVGNDDVYSRAVDMATDVHNLVPKIDTACLTNSVFTKDTSNMTHLDTVAFGTQFGAVTHDIGCDGIAPAQTCN